jgi:hypothetical protein
VHTDARRLEHGSLIEGDLCIVGAGAAGISMALEWVGRGRRVLLLEGGGFDPDPRMQDLYRGEVVGQPYFPLEAARLHYFGGTTNHWAGLCAPFDPIDFEALRHLRSAVGCGGGGAPPRALLAPLAPLGAGGGAVAPAGSTGKPNCHWLSSRSRAGTATIPLSSGTSSRCDGVTIESATSGCRQNSFQ